MDALVSQKGKEDHTDRCFRAFCVFERMCRDTQKDMKFQIQNTTLFVSGQPRYQAYIDTKQLTIN